MFFCTRAYSDLCTGCHALCERLYCEIDLQKVANVIRAKDTDKRPSGSIDSSIRVIIRRFNRSAYLSIEAGCEPPRPDGRRQLALIVALAIGDDR
jgi:hypothetical protein